ncbi:hypothetical protein KCP70_00220 [Salmonella enterica subsp. enterica]|nr:hypothetical protein KCP70_00220 [Salmonella enterica subsp. enterica]
MSGANVAFYPFPTIASSIWMRHFGKRFLMYHRRSSRRAKTFLLASDDVEQFAKRNRVGR